VTILSSRYVTSDPLNRTALPPIVSPIIIEGNGSLIRRAWPTTTEPFRLLRVSVEGKLTLHSATIRAGDATAPDGEYDNDSAGSALRNDDGTLIIDHCRFDNNYNLYNTAGIYTTGPTTITDSRFLDNSCMDCEATAIEALNTSSVIIKRCYFRGNNGERAIALSNAEDAEVSQSSIMEEVSDLNGYGTGISADSSNLRITNCTISRNGTVGLELANSNAVVTHCTITENGPEFPDGNSPIGRLLEFAELDRRFERPGPHPGNIARIAGCTEFFCRTRVT
jgi:parallel beta-helix repeat protein